MSTPAEARATLSQDPLFREFTAAELEQFFNLLDPITVPAGKLIVQQDEEGDSMYLLVSGRARVVHHGPGRDLELATLKAGDFFGELALVDRGPRSADVEAMEDCTLLKLDQGAIAALAGVYPTAAFKLLIAVGRIVVSRLRQANQRYVDSLLFPVAGKEEG
jgi:CRP-like cAMP-binding protein